MRYYSSRGRSMQWQYMANRPIVNIITKSVIHAAIGYILICIINLLILTANILIWNVADDQITKESLPQLFGNKLTSQCRKKKSLADGRKKETAKTHAWINISSIERDDRAQYSDYVYWIQSAKPNYVGRRIPGLVRKSINIPAYTKKLRLKKFEIFLR